MSIFGYNPQKYYTGRGPLEAGSMGIETSGEEVIFRCNLITEKNGKIDDFNAGHITSKEAAILIDDLNKEFLKSSVIDKFGNGKFYSGISYRHLFVKNGSKLSDLKTTPPHDIVGQNIDDFTNWNSDEFLDIKI